MNSIESLNALLCSHKLGRQIAKDIAELLLDDEGTFFLLKIMEERRSILVFQEKKLSKSEEEVFNIIEASDVPISVVQVTQKVTKNRSLKHINRASVILKSLIQKGKIVKTGKNGNINFYSKR